MMRPTGGTMKRIYYAIGVMIAVGFTVLAVANITGPIRQLKLQDVQLETKDAELNKSKLETQRLNDAANKALEDKTTTEEQNREIQKQLEEQIKKNQQLERELSLKREAQRIAKEKAEAGISTSKVYAASADKVRLMDAAGIAQGDRYYVDCVINGCEGVSAEGGWSGVTRWNTAGSGAYGICQALPASKMASAGADYMTNPVTQLRWCDGYAKGYGSWQAAWNFRKCLGSCYSPRTHSTVYKDHTWW